MNHSLIQVLLIVVTVIALTTGQGFYAQRYGKRGETRQARSGFYANRYGRSSPPQDQDLPEVKIRSSRFIGGSRYGKRSGASVIPDMSSIVPSTTEVETDSLSAILVGDSFVCLLTVPDQLYKCVKNVNVETAN